MRTLVIGDIHSGLKALEQLLDRANVQPTDHLIFLGDYVDGWSDAVATIDYLIELQKRYTCTFMRGNHDQLCCDWLSEGKDNPLWFQHGGEATVKSYALITNEKKQRHLQFYETLQNYYLDKQNRLFLHAGFTNLKGVDYEYFEKSFYWDRTLWELALALDPKLPTTADTYPKRLQKYTEIFIGHTPVTRIGLTVPKRVANVWNIDTGAAFKGPLTALDVNDKTFWQSDPVHQFYPNEQGRN